MSPILYESTETAFISNGLVRLRDCISCVVTEERNGIYECDFEYPVDGAHFDEIIPGRIIAVTHDDSGDVQPFDIVSYSKPIDGVASFHAVHISYRQSFLTVTGSGINGISDAFDLLETAVPTNPFTYWTDVTGSGYFSGADGTPKSVRSLLGGSEGSILDCFGGEYEWDKFTVKLHQYRGQRRDFLIRYGVNMTDYEDESDYFGSFTSCIPFWTGEGGPVIGNKVDSGLLPYNGREMCVPLDLTERYENAPTTAQLEAAALSYMQNTQANLPSQNIKVNFLRLQDFAGYEDYGNLLQCNLCDSIGVVFPKYQMQGTYKIVKIVYDVLENRYQEMELGALRTSLSEALGITGSDVTITSGVSQIRYGTCSIASGTAAKTVTVSPALEALDTGALIFVKFANSNSASTPTLNVNGLGAKTIRRYGTTSPSTSAATSWNAGSVIAFVYDGTYWQMVGWINTTYSEISQTNITNSSGSTSGLVTGRRAYAAVQAFETVKDVTVGGTSVMNGTTAVIPSLGPQITSHGTYGTFWAYRVWSDDFQEVWYRGSVTFSSAASQQTNGWYRSTQNVDIPIANMSGMTAFSDDAVVTVSGAYAGRVFTTGGIKTNGTQFEAQQLSGSSMSATTVNGWNVYISGFKRT